MCNLNRMNQSSHHHGHEGDIDRLTNPNVNELGLKILEENNRIAERIRKRMREENILLINIISSAGSGKTSFLEKTADAFKDDLKMAVIVGDLETERDAERIRKHGIQSKQIITGEVCHLEANVVEEAFDKIDIKGLDVIFIENVGNPVCPATYDLGEDFRICLLATTEGDDKPKKYPQLFLHSDLLLISKTDLVPNVPFSCDKAKNEALEINHHLDVIEFSSLNGSGMDEWKDYLYSQIKKKQAKSIAV